MDPAAPGHYCALAFVFLRSNDITKARQAAMKLKGVDPNNQGYQQLFRNLGM